MLEADVNLYRAQNAIDRAWRQIGASFLLRVAAGGSTERLQEISEDEAQRTTREACATLGIINRLDLEALPHEIALTVRIARHQLNIEAQAARRYWLVQSYGMFPALFPVTPYGGGYLLNVIATGLSRFAFTRVADADRYLALVEDYAHLLEQMRLKIIGQAERGIRIPQPAIPGARAVIGGQAKIARARVEVRSRVASTGALPGDFADRVDNRIDTRLLPAFETLRATLDDEYAARAPESVGLGQFAEGVDLYQELVMEHSSMRMSIDAVHRLGVEELERVEAEMAELRADLGYADREAFHRHLLTCPDWIAGRPDDLQVHFADALRRIEPHLMNLFRTTPAARYRIARLPAELESGMTAGYYQPPVAGHPDGVYYFNGANIAGRTLAGMASLIYHELIPGHHFQIASQKENELLPPLRQHLLFNAFSEGWAEYAATLAGEIGMYAHPCERYGRLLKQAYYACRLVTDTGMNALGWPLERARRYFHDHTLLSEREICAETLRYSTDIPAQALSYKLGEIKFLELRERARAACGGRFELRDFHDVVLSAGSMPLDVLDWHVNVWLARLRE